VLQVPTPDVPNVKAVHEWSPLRSPDYPDTEHDVQYSLMCAADDERGPADDARIGNPGPARISDIEKGARIFEQLIESFEVLPVEQ
jgi:hypothetical protein